MSLLDIVPTPARGVVRIGTDCEHCARPIPVLGLPGKGRPIESFAPDYFCRGHAIRLDCDGPNCTRSY